MTGEQFVNIVIKRLMGAVSFREQFLEYLRTQYSNFVAQVYNKNGTFGSSPVAFAIGSADKFSLTTDREGTDGVGRLLKTGDTYEQNVQFENANAIDYYVGMKYAEKPGSAGINPRTGYPEYQSWEEVIGERGDPDEVLDQTGYLRFHFNTVAGGVNESVEGRKALVWKKVPAAGATSEAIAIELCDCHDYGGVPTGTAYCDTVGYLGQDDPSLEAGDYLVLLLGPRVSRYTDLSAAAGYWYIGTVTGGGAGNPPSGSDTSGQRLITKSLSDLLENLVYDNVINTFTRRQNFQPSVDELALYIARNYGGALVEIENNNTGAVRVLWVKGNRPIEGRSNSGATGRAVTGIAELLQSIGVFGVAQAEESDGVAGWNTDTAEHSSEHAGVTGIGERVPGVLAVGKYSAPEHGALRIEGQATDPSLPANGEIWYPDDEHRVKVRADEFKRVFAEGKKVRRLQYPLTLGMPQSAVGGDMEWSHEILSTSGIEWASDGALGRERLAFPLNRVVPQGVKIVAVNIYWNPGAARTGDARTRLDLFSASYENYDRKQHGVLFSHATTGYDWGQMLSSGVQTGPSSSTVLQDSTKDWVVDSLIGKTAYNLTDGSSGTITDNDATSFTCSLSGGGDNLWQPTDYYEIAATTPEVIVDSATRHFWLALWAGNSIPADSMRGLEIYYDEGDYLLIP